MTKPLKEKPILYFICTGNSCRSQMAEGFGKKYAGDDFQVYSAGIEAHGLNPRAVAAMKEVGIDISHHTSDLIDPDILNHAFYVVTLCGDAEERCPYTPPHVKRLHWPLKDPAKATGTEEEITSVFRKVRDQIEKLVKDLVQSAREEWNERYEPKTELERMASLLKVLGDPTRLTIFSLLKARELCVCELTDLLKISQPAISQQLRKLKLANLVKERRVGQWVYYSLRAPKDGERLLTHIIDALPDMSHLLTKEMPKGCKPLDPKADSTDLRLMESNPRL